MRRHMGPTQAKGLDELCAELCGQGRLGTGSKDIPHSHRCASLAGPQTVPAQAQPGPVAAPVCPQI